MLFSLKMAIRFLKSAKGQTIMITLGIAIGVSVQIFIGLLIQGLQSSLIDKTIGSAPHITITATSGNKTIEDYDIILSNASDLPEVKYFSANYEKPAFSDQLSQSVLIRGVTLEGASSIYGLEKSLIAGEMPSEEREILVGKTVFESLQADLRDTINVFIPEKGNKELIISGVFDLKVSSINNTWFITSLQNAQSIFDVEDVVTSIEIQIKDVFKSNITAEELAVKLNNEDLAVVDWQSQNEDLLSGLSGQSVSSIMIQVFVIIAVVLGIASVLAISVLQKSKQIGILKAMGIKDGATSLIFLLQGLMLGFLGAIAGILLGLGLIMAFTAFALNPDGTPLIPLTINYGFIALSGIIAITASMVAALIPAIRSMKMDPIEVIKNG